MCDRYQPYPYANVFPVTPPHAAAWYDGKNMGYVKGHDVCWGVGYQKGMNENIDATFQSGYDKGKAAGYCKGYTSGKEEGYASGQQQGKSTTVSSEQIPPPGSLTVRSGCVPLVVTPLLASGSMPGRCTIWI